MGLIANTTLSRAATASEGQIYLTSATGVVKNSTMIKVDDELMEVISVSGSVVRVHRGSGGTKAAAHALSAVAAIGTPNYFSSFIETEVDPTGAAVGSIALKTEGVANASQSVLNLVGGSNVTITDNGGGEIEIAASGGSFAFSAVPVTKTSTGTAGEMAAQSGELYVCYATNQWMKLVGAVDW